MSSKIVSTDVDLSPETVDNYKFVPPQLDAEGREILSPVTLVSVTDMRPMTLGERVRRYIRTPTFQQDILNDDGYHPDDLHEVPIEDENPISPYEERAWDLQSISRKRKRKEAEDKKNEAIEAEKAVKAEYRRRFKELQAEGADLPDPPTTPSK